MDEKFANSTFAKKNKSGYESAKRNAIWSGLRLAIVILQYMQGMLKISPLPVEQWQSYFDNDDIFSCHLTSHSEEILSTIVQFDAQNCIKEKGKMCLIRVIHQKGGNCLYKTLYKLRRILKLDNVFSIIIDLDDDKNFVGMSAFNENELPFLQRLQRWKGNDNFRARKYSDLFDLPVLLIVVNRGKMGITYHNALSVYDLRLRYTNTSMVKRTPLEQDLGRVCRYKNESSEEYPMATVLISRLCKNQVMSTTSRGGIERGGIKSLDPDYLQKMAPLKRKEFYCPKTDGDFTPYSKHWEARKKNYDYKHNPEEKCLTRYLLVGRPQIGKTGAFLHLIFLVWKKMNINVVNTYNNEEDLILDSDIEEADDDNEMNSITNAEENVELLKNINASSFPPFHLLKQLALQPKYPQASPRYGDPSIKEDRKHYLTLGRPYLPQRLLLQQKRNSLLERARPETSIALQTENKNLSENNISMFDNENDMKRRLVRSDRTKYGSVPLKMPDNTTTINQMDYKNKYTQITLRFGNLYINNLKKHHRWITSESKYPRIHQNIKLIPIVICSSNRAKSGFLDLTKAMDGETTYIEILVIREEEEAEYFVLAQHYKNIDVFVIPKNKAHTVGTARHYAKRLAHLIFKDFVFFLDDNIRGWSGVLFINDPCPLPMLQKEPCMKSHRMKILVFVPC